MKKPEVLIVGAGIAGPALAYWLSRTGYRPTVVEHARQLRSGGSAIVVKGPAIPVADRMGILPQLRGLATRNRSLPLLDPGGRRILQLPLTSDKAPTVPLTLLTGYQTPAALRRTGKKRLESWLRNRKVLRADLLAGTALEVAGHQHTSLPGEKLTAQMVHTLAVEVMALNQQVAEIDKAIEARFREHQDYEVITSMPGLGVIPGAEFLAATGGDMSAFGTADRLAGFGGVAPMPRDSGKISGNLRRPRRYNRRLQRVFYISALFSIRRCEESRRFYERERAEGKRHIQAVLALARRRVNVLWALLRDGRTYELAPPTALAA
ncbi:transposase [Streptomyces kanamyceticus]|uniref:transposase n=1 Tax=Streptomyces kanamyceticus TaxID=1967 RepID=UPI0037DDCAB2